MKKITSKILSFFISPFFLGLIITVIFIKVSVEYYDSSDVDIKRSQMLSTLVRWHHWTVDMRMVNRGFRPGSDRVAVLAVDERALEQEGRWPWPRQKIAKVLSEVIRHGARVVAFDIIFAEPDENSATVTLNRLKKRIGGDPSLKELIEDELKVANSDPILAQTVETFSNRLVLGAYFDQLWLDFEPYQEQCLARLYESSTAFKNWDNELYKVVTFDDVSTIPEPFIGLLETQFDLIRETSTEEFCRDPQHKSLEGSCPDDLDPKTQRLLTLYVEQNQSRYCQRWLVSNRKEGENDELLGTLEELWPQIQEVEESFTGISFEDGIAEIKRKIVSHPIPLNGRWWMNLPMIAANTKHTGYFNAFQDPDGAIRRSQILSRSGNELVPSLALKAFMVDQGYSGALISIGQDAKGHKEGREVKVVKELSLTVDGEPTHKIPVNQHGELLINYAGPRYMFAHASVADVLNPNSDEMTITQRRFDAITSRFLENTEHKMKKSDFFKDKILVFGATATGIYDLRVTPFEENYPGVETHANVIDNMVRQDYLLNHSDEPVYMFALLLVLGILFSLTLSYLGAAPGLLLTLFSLLSIYYVDKNYLFEKGIIVSIVFPILLVLSNYVILTFYKYFTEERQKKELKGTFEKYVSPAIVNEVLADPSNVELGGRKVRLTVFFSDVRGFTTISEKLDPKTLSDLLNSYLTPMTNLVFANKGTLDKYMGDAIMAFFGAPIHYEDHAKCACRCALQHIEKLKGLQREFRQKGLPPIDIGIGLNTGEVSVGNMGSNTVRNYTVMGDSVNLGSRLEGINKQYGTRIIISEFTYEEVKDSFVAREIDWVRVKGKALPVKIYELMGEHRIDEEAQKMVHEFNVGFKLYHDQKWKEASEAFSRGLTVTPDDPVCQLYLERCAEYLETPPPSDWDGVYVMTTK